GTQVLIAVTLVLANRVEGGVVAYQIAYTFYLLPFALVAHPIFMSLYPRLSADAHAARWSAFAEDLGHGVRRTALLVAPAAGLLAALGRPALELVRLGALDRTGARLVASVLAAYAVGLVGYSVFQLLARAATATGDARPRAPGWPRSGWCCGRPGSRSCGLWSAVDDSRRRRRRCEGRRRLRRRHRGRPPGVGRGGPGAGRRRRLVRRDCHGRPGRRGRRAA